MFVIRRRSIDAKPCNSWSRCVSSKILFSLDKLGLVALGGYGQSSFATVAEQTQVGQLSFTIHNLWLLLATAMVFLMHLGFACLEASSVQPKNRINILFKNVFIISLGILAYAVVGFNLMYPGAEFAGGFFGFSGFGVSPGPQGLTTSYNAHYTYWADFIFQAMFAATAATVVSGAVAERMKLSSFIVFSVLLVSFIYPIVGMWKWGGGFLDTLNTPFYDFAGSTLVHAVGGWAALVGAVLVGPRLHRKTFKDGTKVLEQEPLKDQPVLATVGVFLLWFGWYGFNGGSVLSADPAALSTVFVTTSLAAAAGVVGAGLVSLFVTKHFNLVMLLNGALAGLVSITAGADQMAAMDAVLIGLAGGVLVVFCILGLNRMKIDDPVNAISVHLACGIWGTVAVGLFGNLASLAQLQVQFAGTFMIGFFTLLVSFVALKLIDVTMGLRVCEKTEKIGLDVAEHGVEANAKFA